MYYIILKNQNQDIGTKIKNFKIKNPINSSHRKKNWLVFFAHIGKKLVLTFGSNEGVGWRWLYWWNALYFNNITNDTYTKAPNEKRIPVFSSIKTCAISGTFRRRYRPKKINAHIWAGLQFHIYWFWNIKFYIINIYVM